MERYREKTPQSRELFQRANRIFAGGVNHNIRTFGLVSSGAYPPFMEKGKGSHLWDVDGNEYVDWWMTHFSQILGHNHPEVMAAIRERLTNGNHLGALNNEQVILGEQLQQAIPLLEKMRFCTTGSEATMYAVRLARIFTGRKLAAKARGGWHGGNDSLGYHLKFPFTDDPFFDGVSFDFNDQNSTDAMFKKFGNELAALIIEPVLGAGGGLPPENGFLKYLREETEQRGIVLIFDEIITGFRLCFGSAGTDFFGVKPDLITLGKIVAGGMPLGVYGGKEEIMKLAEPGAENSRWVGGGTFSSHPLTMAAGIAVLNQLKTLKQQYNCLNKKGEEFRNRLNKLFEEADANAIATGVGSIIFVHWLKYKIDKMTGVSIGEAIDHNQLDLFQSVLIENGIFGYHGLGALSFAHTSDDIERTFEAVKRTITTIIEK